jgi:endo-1,3-1,4-beta-glycanase ExoK
MATCQSGGVNGRHVRTLLVLGVLAAAAGCGGSGQPSGAGGTGGSAPPTGTFQLAWQDDFDAFDAARWQLMTHTWDGNLAQFSTANTRFTDGIASLLLTPEPTDTAKPFRGVEMRSRDTLTYGKVESRVRFAKGSGVVSSLVLIYTPWPADDWNELDVEYLGRYTDRVQSNVQVYTGPPKTPPVTTSVTPAQYTESLTSAFDPSADFHVYTMEWTPAEVRFLVDDELKRSWNTRIDLLKLPQNILLTIWASNAAGWAGPIEADSAPTQADYDWIHVYRWVPDSP